MCWGAAGSLGTHARLPCCFLVSVGNVDAHPFPLPSRWKEKARILRPATLLRGKEGSPNPGPLFYISPVMSSSGEDVSRKAGGPLEQQ